MSEVTHDPQHDYIQSLERQIEQLQHEKQNLLTCQCEQCDNSLEEDAVCRACYAAIQYDRDRLWKENAHLQGELTYQTSLAAKAKAAPPAVWSRERPTVAGWYWYRTHAGNTQSVVEIDQSLDPWRIGILGGEWAGPLRPPVEGK